MANYLVKGKIYENIKAAMKAAGATEIPLYPQFSKLPAKYAGVITKIDGNGSAKTTKGTVTVTKVTNNAKTKTAVAKTGKVVINVTTKNLLGEEGYKGNFYVKFDATTDHKGDLPEVGLSRNVSGPCRFPINKIGEHGHATNYQTEALRQEYIDRVTGDIKAALDQLGIGLTIKNS